MKSLRCPTLHWAGEGTVFRYCCIEHKTVLHSESSTTVEHRGHIRLLRVSVWITSIGVSGGSNDVGAISRMYDTADLYPVEGGLLVLLIFFGLPLESLL